MRRRQDHGVGFTLIELAIALLIFLIGAIGLLQLMIYSVSINQRNRDTSITAALAQAKADQLLESAFNNLTVGGIIPTTANRNPLTSPNPSPVTNYVEFFNFDGVQITGNSVPAPQGTYFVRQWQVLNCDASCASGPTPPSNICTSACGVGTTKKVIVTVTALNPVFKGSFVATTVVVYKARILDGSI